MTTDIIKSQTRGVRKEPIFTVICSICRNYHWVYDADPSDKIYIGINEGTSPHIPFNKKVMKMEGIDSNAEIQNSRW